MSHEEWVCNVVSVYVPLTLLDGNRFQCRRWMKFDSLDAVVRIERIQFAWLQIVKFTWKMCDFSRQRFFSSVRCVNSERQTHTKMNIIVLHSKTTQHRTYKPTIMGTAWYFEYSTNVCCALYVFVQLFTCHAK